MKHLTVSQSLMKRGPKFSKNPGGRQAGFYFGVTLAKRR
jgi:hypothetical protein